MKMMAFSAIFSLAFVSVANAQVYVRGYTRSDGTYVAPHMRSSPDGTVTNNYSYQGSRNPYTGEIGTNRYQHDATSPNFSGPDNSGNVGHSYYSNQPYQSMYGR